MASAPWSAEEQSLVASVFQTQPGALKPHLACFVRLLFCVGLFKFVSSMRYPSSKTFLRSAVCLTQSAFLLLGQGFPVLAQGPAKLDQYEQTVFGETHSSMAEEARLQALEVNLFGKAKTGSASSRLDGISKALGGGKNLLMPAMAPKMDSTAINKTEDSLPPVAPDPAYSRSTAYSSGGAPPPLAASDAVKESLKQALQLYSQGDSQRAERAFRHVLSLDSRNTDALYNLGVIAEGRGDYQEALNNYGAASNINPGDRDLKDAVASMRNKLQEKAIADQRTNSQNNQASKEQLRESLKPLVSDASAAYKAGNFDKAIIDLQTVARQAPNDSDVQYALAQAYRGKKNYQQAQIYLNKALSLDPNNQLYKTSMGEVNRELASTRTGGGSSYNGNGGGNASYTEGIGYGGSPSNSAGSVQSFDQKGWQGSGSSSDSSSTPTVGFAPVNDQNSNGGVTPFTDSGRVQQGYARGGGMFGGGMAGNNSGSYRLKRAAVSGITGATMGAITGAMFSGYGGRSRGAMRGAMVGGALGLITGGLLGR